MYNDDQRQALLQIAKAAIFCAINHRPLPQIDVKDDSLKQPCGAFVTIKRYDRLRGCIGRFDSTDPLWQTVRDVANLAATRDVRFANDPLLPYELDDCHIHISVLSPLEKIDDPLNIEVGTHGIQVREGQRSGCYLPEVATDANLTKEQFLSSCCQHKAGFAPDAWKGDSVEVYRFTTESIE